MTAARSAALDVLRAVRGGELADRAFDRATHGVPARDRAWLHELVYGTVRLRGLIDAILSRHVRRGLESLEPDVLDLLRLGTYQITQMTSVPAYAAVSQSVELAKSVGGKGASGLVNGVLKAVAREPEPGPIGGPIDALATLGSHPRWLVERWARRYGVEQAAELIEADNSRPDLYIRPIGISRDEAVERLAEGGITAEPVPLSPDSLRILPPGTAIEALETVPCIVQDPAGALVARYAAVPQAGVAADVCAAPGGKAMELATSARYAVASDLSLGRLRRVRQNRDRLELPNLGLVVADARHPPYRPLAAVLVDAPCTGTGTFRRHPDGKWRVAPPDLQSLARLQEDILDGAAETVAPGGLLVYSTCSLEPEENEAQAAAFLDRHRDFRFEPTPAEVPAEMIDTNGYLSVLPQRTGFDGAFAARFRREA